MGEILRRFFRAVEDGAALRVHDCDFDFDFNWLGEDTSLRVTGRCILYVRAGRLYSQTSMIRDNFMWYNQAKVYIYNVKDNHVCHKEGVFVFY